MVHEKRELGMAKMSGFDSIQWTGNACTEKAPIHINEPYCIESLRLATSSMSLALETKTAPSELSSLLAALSQALCFGEKPPLHRGR